MSKMLINAYSSSPNQITHIYSENGTVKREVVDFKPFLGTHCLPTEPTSWTDMYGKPIKIKKFDSIMDMNKWKKENKKIMDVFGDIDVVDMFVATQYRKDIVLDKTGMKIFNFDIECVQDENGVSTGFPNVTDTKNEITSIAINEMVSNTYYVFAYVDYTIKNDNEIFIRCKDERDLIKKFLDFWNKENPQIITGWSIKSFDIPYLVNRINKICGPEEVKRLSIDRAIGKHKDVDIKGNETITYSLQGHIIWDYIELYQKYTQENRESYTLEHIATTELGNHKVVYHDEYDNLQELYLNDPQKFLEYNIKDTTLVYELDYKLDYINVAMSIMHKARCRPDKIFGTLAPWDCIIYNELLDRKILCPPNTNHSKVDFVGGWVGDPEVGLHEWLMVYDIVSSYPNQIRSLNLSPETIIPDTRLPQELKDIKEKYTGIDICANINKISKIKDTLKKYNVCFTSNGYFFDVSKEGIIPSIFTKLFALRKEYKRQLKEHNKLGNEREAKIADLYQYTIKILLNSGFGAISNNFSRYFDIRIGEAITSNGQVSCKGMINTLTKKLNLDVKYCDTDSNFVALDKILVKRFGDKLPELDNKTKVDFLLKYSQRCIEPSLNEFFIQLSEAINMRELTIFVEPECIADVTLFTAKKRYIMNKLWDEGTYLIDHPKRKIRGVEIVRSSTPKVCRDRLKDAVELIFTTKSNDILIDFIDTFKKEFYTLPIETISFPRSVKIAKWKQGDSGLPIGVCSAFTYNDTLKKYKLDLKYKSIADGDKIKFCYQKMPNKFNSKVIGFINKFPEEIRCDLNTDYDLQFEKSFLSPLRKIFQAIGWNIEKIITLEDFF